MAFDPIVQAVCAGSPHEWEDKQPDNLKFWLPENFPLLTPPTSHADVRRIYGRRTLLASLAYGPRVGDAQDGDAHRTVSEPPTDLPRIGKRTGGRRVARRRGAQHRERLLLRRCRGATTETAADWNHAGHSRRCRISTPVARYLRSTRGVVCAREYWAAAGPHDRSGGHAASYALRRCGG